LRRAGCIAVGGRGCGVNLVCLFREACDCIELCFDCGSESVREGLLDVDPNLFAGDRSPFPSEDDDHRDREVVGLVERETFDIRLVFAFDGMLARFALSGNPSHFAFVGGTESGSFLEETPGNPTLSGFTPFSAAALFCAFAYSSHAEVDGSFSVRKPSTPDFFFFGFSAFACVFLGLELRSAGFSLL
jgi:hypothetical protein